MQPEKQIELLNKTMSELNRDNATSEDVKKLFELSLKAIETVKTNILKEIKNHQGETSTSAKNFLVELKKLEGRMAVIDHTIKENKTRFVQDLDNTIIQVFRELRRIEGIIPTLPDLKPLEAKISVVERKIPVLKDVEPEEIRDKLETLKGEERLDAKAIKNLPKTVQGLVGGSPGIKGITSSNHNITVTDSSNYVGFKNLKFAPKITVSATQPTDPELHDLWVDIS